MAAENQSPPAKPVFARSRAKMAGDRGGRGDPFEKERTRRERFLDEVIRIAGMVSRRGRQDERQRFLEEIRIAAHRPGYRQKKTPAKPEPTA
jgi:hypothetical protein